MGIAEGKERKKFYNNHDIVIGEAMAMADYAFVQ
jgi:hypothetical protein